MNISFHTEELMYSVYDLQFTPINSFEDARWARRALQRIEKKKKIHEININIQRNLNDGDNNKKKWIFKRPTATTLWSPASTQYIKYEPLRLPRYVCFFCLARAFWNHTCVTRLLRPAFSAILSKSCPSGLLSISKFRCNTSSCSSVNAVRTRLIFFFDESSPPK